MYCEYVGFKSWTGARDLSISAISKIVGRRADNRQFHMVWKFSSRATTMASEIREDASGDDNRGWTAKRISLADDGWSDFCRGYIESEKELGDDGSHYNYMTRNSCTNHQVANNYKIGLSSRMISRRRMTISQYHQNDALEKIGCI